MHFQIVLWKQKSLLRKVYWQTLKMWLLFCFLLKKIKVINSHLGVDFPISRMLVNWLYITHADRPCSTMVFLLTLAKPVVEIFSKRTQVDFPPAMFNCMQSLISSRGAERRKTSLQGRLMLILSVELQL